MRPDTRHNKSHLAFLDGLRGLAAIYVVLFHVLSQLPESFGALSPKHRFALGWLHYGHYAVTIFIILSGFCLMIPIARGKGLVGGPMNFIRKRAIRILPPYYATVALCLLLIATVIGQKTGTRWDSGFPVTNLDIVLHLVLLHDLWASTGGKIAHTLWSIAVEWRIYFLFPVLLWAWQRWGAFPVLLVSLILSFTGQYLLAYTDFNTLGWGVNVHFVGMFVFGMVACDIALGTCITPMFLNGNALKKVIVLGLAINFLLLQIPSGWPYYIHDFFLALWFCPFLIFLATHDASVANRVLCWKPFIFFGTFSYSLYLTHAPILQIVTQYVVRPLKWELIPAPIQMMFFSVVICSGAAYIFYLCFERPFLREKPPLPKPLSAIVNLYLVRVRR